MISSKPSTTARSPESSTLQRVGLLIAPVVRPFAISRLAVLLMALALGWLLDSGRAYRYDFVGDAPLAPLSATFDANWFGSIATEGYSRSADVSQQQNYHFFPLFPLTMKLAGDLLGLGGMVGGYHVAGVIVSHLFFFLALAALYRLTLLAFRSERTASAAVWIAAFAPWSFVFSMAYTEALFLLLSTLALLTALEAHREPNPVKVAAASLLVAAAALTRPQGLVLVLPVVILLAFDGRVRSWRGRAAVMAAVAAPGALAVTAFFLYIGDRTGNMWALLQVNRTWGEGWLPDVSRLFILPPANPMWFVDIVSTAGLLIWASLVIYQILLWRGRGTDTPPSEASEQRAWLAYSVVFFAFTLLANPSNGGWGRYMVVVPPIIWVVAQGSVSAPERNKRMLLTVSLTLQVIMLAAAVMLQVTP